MINATKERLASFFQGTIQYEVPFFQRAYVWDEDNWSTLWDHVTNVVAKHDQGLGGEHFIGTVITKQRQAARLGEQVHDLIDGQQRLTTIAVLLKAIADTAKGDLPRLKEVINDYLQFRDTHNRVHPRIIPSSYDREYFTAVMNSEPGTNGDPRDHKIIRAYDFFVERLREMTDDRREQLRLVLLEKVSVISMMLSHEDDEQEIFDTINALGARLTTAELLKNFIFKDKSIQTEYGRLWKSVYEDSEEQVEFWNTERTAGRIIRTNVEVLLYCYLVIETGAEVRLESLFKEYKTWLGPKNGPERLSVLEELTDYAELFMEFPSGSELNQIDCQDWEKRFFHLVEYLSITTVLPLVLYLYRSVPNLEERSKLMGLLESYLVRRNVCRLTTKNYNLLFVQILKRLGELPQVSYNGLRDILLGFSEDTNRLPRDAEFTDAFSSSVLSNQNAGEILFLIALRQVATGLSDVSKLSRGNYSVEHMMPVKWERNWPTPGFTADQKIERGKRLRTLGNLTLVTKKLNSKLQNAAWESKRTVLRQYSSLPLTVPYVEKPIWDEAAIEARASDLAKVALELWPTP